MNLSLSNAEPSSLPPQPWSLHRHKTCWSIKDARGKGVVSGVPGVDGAVLQFIIDAAAEKFVRETPIPERGFFLTWTPDFVGEVLCTGFMRFTSAFGIDGLARLDGNGGLDVLAVIATAPGNGQFRNFIAAAKKMFRRVAIWEDWNPIIGEALMRYGFAPARYAGSSGEVNNGWEWKRVALWQCPQCGARQTEALDVYANVFCACGTEMGYIADTTEPGTTDD